MANREELALIRGARAGQAAAQLALGERYLHGGQGLPRNLATALHWLDRAARQDCEQAWILIGSHIPFESVQQSANPAAYIVWYERAFDSGVVAAGLVLAKLVLSEEPLSGDAALYAKACKLLEMAAQAGVAEAQWLLAQQAVRSNVEDASRAEVDAQPVSVAAVTAALASAAPQAVDTVRTWTARAAGSGVPQAQLALAEHAWSVGDHEAFLRWALPLARAMEQQDQQQTQLRAPLNEVSKLPPRAWADEEVALVSRCAQVMMHRPDSDADEVQRFWELAAREDDKLAQLSLGLRFARMDINGVRNSSGSGSANFKKAIRWLTLAGEQGLSDAWFALSRIYLKPEFSQRNVQDAQHYLERAAEMGHCAAQIECGNSAWRARRDHPDNDVRAVYWLQKAVAQGSEEAVALLDKLAVSAKSAPWARVALGQLTREMLKSHPFLAARIELAALFGLTRPEALLLDLNAADKGHCLLVDIRSHYGRSKRRLILVQTGQERQALNRIGRLFEDVDCGVTGPEGNYRQRLYRLKTLLPNLEMAEQADEDRQFKAA